MKTMSLFLVFYGMKYYFPSWIYVCYTIYKESE
nr:MAG TPA: hypothetical protein [Caudoviricetes sp.]